ncbi:hypothetical protein Tco_0382557 [Tanacetum coccineum]
MDTMKLVQGADLRRLVSFDVFRKARVAREDDRRVTEGREDVREVFQQRRSGAKRKLSRCGRDQMGNEPILALPEGADDFVVYYDARSKDLEACLEKGRSEYGFEAKYHMGKANVVVESWSRRKSEAKNEFWIDVLRSKIRSRKDVGGLLLQPELPEYKWERITKDIIVKLPSVSGGYDATWV